MKSSGLTSAETGLMRLVTTWPTPPAWADYGPFRQMQRGPGSLAAADRPGAGPSYGLVELSGSASAAYAEVEAVVRRGFLQQETVGFAALERVRAVFFDMDATVIVEESLVELAAYAGVQAEVALVTERAMAGELDFHAALTSRVALLRGLPVGVLAEVAARLTLMPGIVAFVALCRQLGVPTYMVSGGFVQLATIVAGKVGFTGYHACRLGVDQEQLTGTIEGPVVDAQAKLDFVEKTCLILGCTPTQVACVGDGANDGLMLAAAGVAIGHQAKPILYPHLHALNSGGDHGFLAPLLFGRGLS